MTGQPRRVLLGAALLGLAALAAAGWSWWPWRSANDPVIQASGRIEVTEVTVSSKVTGRIAVLHVEEGADVKRGQPVATLAGEELEALLRQARATLQSAEARRDQARIALRVEPIAVQSQIRQAEEAVRAADERLRLLESGSRVQEIEEARANLNQALARQDIARLTRDRFLGLLADGAISRQDFDRTATDLQAAEAAVRAARERVSLVEEGARAEDIRIARAERDRAAAALEAARAGAAAVDIRQQEVRVAEAAVREARANVERLETQVAELRVLAPLDATVLTKAAEPGEVVAANKPIVLLGDLDRPWIKVYVPETALGRIRLGAPARVFVDSFPGRPFQGTVTWIADQAEFTPKNIQTAEERVNLVYAVKIAIQDAQRRLKAGMPADAELPTDAGVARRTSAIP
jgi:HlyD family secretion protein